MTDTRTKKPRTAKAKREDQARGVRYGCHVEVDWDAGEMPDDCVKDFGADRDCIYATRHRTREGCRFWQPMTERGHE